MDIKDVELRIAEIEREKDDFERAHGMTDQLYRDVLNAIASGEAEHPRRLARAVLKVEDVGFPRYAA